MIGRSDEGGGNISNPAKAEQKFQLYRELRIRAEAVISDQCLGSGSAWKDENPDPGCS